MTEKIIVSFLGLPASGKGTQALLFAEKYGFKMIGIGDLIRREITLNTHPEINEIRAKYQAGEPQDDLIVMELVKKELQSIEGGVVFDNFPFSIPQAQELDKFVTENGWSGPFFINIKVSPESSIQRITTRKICPTCSAIYADRNKTVCDRCGATLALRSDDTEETIKKRITLAEPRIEEIQQIYSSKGNFYEVNGNLAIAEVSAEIDNLEISKRIKEKIEKAREQHIEQ